MTDKILPIKIGFCGEVNSGKSTALQSILRQAFLPDFFGVEKHPAIRVLLGADVAFARYLTADGVLHDIEDPRAIEASEEITEIIVAFQQPFGLRRPCELVEFAPLRDGHVDASQIQDIAACDAIVWTTIGSQAWRLSEKTILDDFAKQLPEKKLLVATRADKFRNDTDREKLRTRLENETAGYFQSLHLLGVAPNSFETPEDAAIWRENGVVDFCKALNTMLQAIPQKTEAIETSLVQESAADDSNEDIVEAAIEPDQAPNEVTDAETALHDVGTTVQMPDAAAIEDEPVQPPSETKQDPIAEIVATTKGIVAIGICDKADPSVQNHIYGDGEDIDRFGRFCVAAVSAAGHFSMCTETSDDIADMQVVSDRHNIFLRHEDAKVIFIVGQASHASAGILRMVLSRLIEEGLTNGPGIFKAA